MRKNLIILWLVLSSAISSAQIIDTVCVGAVRNYGVHGSLNDTFIWNVTGGTYTSISLKSDTIKVQWGNIPGIYPISVKETNIHNCDSTVHGNVLVVAYPVVNLGADKSICPGDILILDATTPYATSYKWQDNSINPKYTVTYPGGIYWVTVSINNMCFAYDTIKVNNLTNPPDFYLFQDTTLCEGVPIEISIPNGNLYHNILWNDGGTNFTQFFNSTGNYYIDLTPPCGPSFKKYFKITYINCDYTLYYPNAITLNGDGYNDEFRAYYSGKFEYYLLVIYNRWGDKLFETNDPNDRWDGKFKNEYVKSDVYVWMVKYSGPYTNGIQGKHGTVTVVR